MNGVVQGIVAKELADLINSGKKVTVRILDALWDDSWGDKGMIADVVWVTGPDGDGCYKFKFDYNNYRGTNLPLQGCDWYLKGGGTGTAFEAGSMDLNDIQEEVFFFETDGIPVEIIADGLLGEYLAWKEQGATVFYTEWLEAQLNLTRNLAEKLQSEKNTLLQEVHGG